MKYQEENDSLRDTLDSEISQVAKVFQGGFSGSSSTLSIPDDSFFRPLSMKRILN